MGLKNIFVMLVLALSVLSLSSCGGRKPPSKKAKKEVVKKENEPRKELKPKEKTKDPEAKDPVKPVVTEVPAKPAGDSDNTPPVAPQEPVVTVATPSQNAGNVVVGTPVVSAPTGSNESRLPPKLRKNTAKPKMKISQLEAEDGNFKLNDGEKILACEEKDNLLAGKTYIVAGSDFLSQIEKTNLVWFRDIPVTASYNNWASNSAEWALNWVVGAAKNVLGREVEKKKFICKIIDRPAPISPGENVLPAYPGLKSLRKETHSWLRASEVFNLNADTAIHTFEKEVFYFEGSASITAENVVIKAKDISNYTGTITCLNSCRIITETPIDQFKMTLKGEFELTFDVVLVNQG